MGGYGIGDMLLEVEYGHEHILNFFFLSIFAFCILFSSMDWFYYFENTWIEWDFGWRKILSPIHMMSYKPIIYDYEMWVFSSSNLVKN